MRKFLLAASLAAAFMLSGCATTGTNQASFIEQVRQAAVAVCGFLPTVDTVGQIILAGNPAFITASAIANGICAAVANVPPLSARKGAAPPTVAGVVIHGRFIR